MRKSEGVWRSCIGTGLVFLIVGSGIARQLQKTDSLKNLLSQSTDSTEVAGLCMELYRLAKYELLVENANEGEFLMRALRIYESTKDYDNIGEVYNALGGIYYNRKQYTEAQKYWILSKQYYQKSGNHDYELILLSNLSLTYLGDTSVYGRQLMKAYLDSALLMRNMLKDSCILVSVCDNLGSWEMRYGSLENAIAYTERGLSIANACRRLRSSQALTFQLGSIRRKQGRFSEAIDLIRESLNYNSMRKTDPNYADAVLELSELYYQVGKYKQAYDYQCQYQKCRDTLFQIEQAKTLMDLEIAYESEKKEFTIQQKDSEVKLLQVRNRSKNRLLLIVFISCVLLFGGAYFYRSYRFIIQSKEMEIRYSRQLLIAHEEERKRISQDLHDSVGQSLILIKNRVALNTEKDKINMVAKALEEVRSISKALHPPVLENLGLTASIKKLIHEMDECSGIFFNGEIDLIDGVFSRENELQIYRIIQECLNNVLKHAQTNSVFVLVKEELKRVVVQVKDYGIGFDMTRDLGTGLGMKTLKGRTQLLDGKLLIESVKKIGTTITLYVEKPPVEV